MGVLREEFGNSLEDGLFRLGGPLFFRLSST